MPPYLLESDWKPSKPGGSFKLSEYDENFDQVMYDIYENNPKGRTFMPWFKRKIEKAQILSFEKYSTDKEWTIIQGLGEIFF